MRARTTATTVVLRRRMLHPLSRFRPKKVLSVEQVFPLFSFFLNKFQFSTSSFQEPQKSNDTHSNSSSINPTGIAKSVFLKCSHLWVKKCDNFSTPLKDHISKLSTISPETIRKFRRVLELKPDDVLEILLGFESKCEKLANEVEMVKSLWGLFNWAREKSKVFEHLPKSYELMAIMLVRVGLFRETEFLLSSMGSKGILLDSVEIFSNLIEGYVKEGEAEKAILMFDRMRARGLVPSVSAYRVIIDFLIKKDDTHLAFRFYTEMVQIGLGFSSSEAGIFENVVQLLCRDGQVQEARNLVRKIIPFGIKPSNLVLDAIAGGYCEKKDYDDLLKFFAETSCTPDVVLGTKVIYSLCWNFGLEKASLFLRELENLGFNPDEITYGIVIAWSCREGKLKNGFIYLSEILSRSLEPHVRSYNALISGVFKEGMWKHARDIVFEMDDKGVTPNLETFRVLLAGYFEARQFDEVKVVIGEMVERGLLSISPLKDPLSEAFLLLGLDPLAVKVRRDNDVGLSKTEFFDNLGNGLYLDTDITEFEKVVNRVLEDVLVPDFNSLISQNCGKGDIKAAVIMVEEMIRWGQEMSFTAFSELVKGLCTLKYSMKTVVNLVERIPKFTNQLDEETLNLLVQALSKKGFMKNARTIFDGMSQRHLTIKTETYNALITGLCKKGNSSGLVKCWEFARLDKWSPKLKDCKALFGYQCQERLLREALELFENMFLDNPSIRLIILHDFLESLCNSELTSIAHALVDELQKQGFALDHISYSYLMRGFFKEKMRSKAFVLLDFMLAKDLVPCLDVTVLSISHLSRAGEFEKAIALKEIVLRDQSSSPISIYCALVGGFCRSGLVEKAANIFRDMLLLGLLPDSKVCNLMVQGYCQCNNLRGVGEILSVMIRKNLRISISSYRNLVCLMCTRGRVFSALSLKELLLSDCDPPHLIVYNILIFYFFRTGNSSYVQALLDELLDKGLQFDRVTYDFLVYGYFCCKKVSRSVEYLGTMLSLGHRPSDRSMRTVIRCFCSDGEIEKALELSREMESRGWTHDSIIQDAIVEGLLAQGKVEEAVRFLDRVIEKDLIPDNINYDNLIKQLCRYGTEDKAVVLLNIVLKKGNTPSSLTYDCLVQYFCAAHKLDQALDFLFEMLDRNLKPNMKTWDTLIYGVCHDGRTIVAERILYTMDQIGEKPSREIYCSLINRYYSERKLNKASEILQKMQQNGYEPDFRTHWSLISDLKKSADKDTGNSSRPFLSRLLSESGFALKNDCKAKSR